MGYRAVEGRLVPLLDRLEFGDASIDEENIELPECLCHCLCHGLLFRDVARIGSDDQYFTAEFFAGALNRFRVGTGNGDTCAFSGKLARGLKTNSAGTAGYKCCLVFKTKHDRIPFHDVLGSARMDPRRLLRKVWCLKGDPISLRMQELTFGIVEQ